MRIVLILWHEAGRFRELGERPTVASRHQQISGPGRGILTLGTLAVYTALEEHGGGVGKL